MDSKERNTELATALQEARKQTSEYSALAFSNAKKFELLEKSNSVLQETYHTFGGTQ